MGIRQTRTRRSRPARGLTPSGCAPSCSRRGSKYPSWAFGPTNGITEIDGTSVVGLTINQVIAKLCGPVDSQVKVKVLRPQAAPTEFALTRAPIYVPNVELQIKAEGGSLVAEETGLWPILDFEKGKALALKPLSGSEFYVDGLDHTRIAVIRD